MSGPAVPRADGTPASVPAIAALEDRPALRNLLITWSYHRLSERLADLLGRDNLNWPTYATWASKQAGSLIREETLGRDLRRALEAKAGLRRRLRRFLTAMERVDGAAMGPYRHREDLGPVLEVSRQVSVFLQGGNTIVFAELGHLFARFVATFGDAPAPGGLDALLADLRPGPAEPDRVAMGGDGRLVMEPRGGQELLRRAMRAYHAALGETDPKRKAELILLGSAQAGLHEQIRLQPYIAAGLEAPVDEILYSRHRDALAQRLKGAALGRARAVLDRWFMPLGEELLETWRAVATRKLTTLPLPGQTLRLGEDLPAPPGGGPLFPTHLERLDDRKLVETLERYGAHGPVGMRHWWARLLVRLGLRRPAVAGSAARDWAVLDERMRYIFTLFRSRQAEAALFAPPFTARQVAELEAGRVPVGEL